MGRGLLFVTLTYPARYPGDWPTWKRQLDFMARKFVRQFPRFGAVWKLEPQTRGAPHFHLLVVGLPFIEADWLRWRWSRILQPGIGPPRNIRVEIERARSHRGVVSYAAKYVAKHQALPADWQDGVGRWWGVIGRANLGIVWKWAPLSQPQFWQANRIIRSLVATRQKRQSRSPPRPCSAGMWAVLKDWQALRIARCVLDSPNREDPTARRERTFLQQSDVSRTEMLDYLARRPQDAALASRCAAAYAGEALPASRQD